MVCIPGAAVEIQGSNVQCETLQVRSCLTVNGTDIAPVPVLTPGSVPFAGPAGTLTQDNAALFWAAATDRLGLGTNAPAKTLHVVSAEASAAAARIRSSVATGYSAVEFGSSDPVEGVSGVIGFGNDLVAIPHFVARNFWMSQDETGQAIPIVFGTGAVKSFEFAVATTEIGLEMGRGESGAVAPASRGKLIYSLADNGFRQSSNTGAFRTLATQDAALTPGSVPFAGVTGGLAQDNPNFFWDDTNNRLGIGNAAPQYRLDVTGNLANSTAKVRNTDAASYSTIDFFDNSDVQQCAIGQGNPGGIASLANVNFLFSATGRDWCVSNATDIPLRFHPVSGSAGLTLANGQAGPAPVSVAGKCRFKYNDTAKTLQLSFDGAPYVTVVTI